MKRWLIVLLIALAVLLLLSPGIVGRLAEKSLDENLSWVEKENTGIVIEAERFDRGWFSSESRHRIALRDSAVIDLLSTNPDTVRSGSPALIVDTRFDHGLIPITSMGWDEGSLRPRLASSVSTLQYDWGFGSLVDVPGKIYSYIGLTGESRFRYLVGRGSEVADGLQIDWSGADLTVVTSARRQSFSIDGTIEPISSVLSDIGVTSIGQIVIDAEQDRSRYTFGVGALKLEVDYVVWRIVDMPNAGFGELVLDAKTELDGDRVNGSASLTIKDIVVPEFDKAEFNTDIVFSDLDADAVEVIVAALSKLGDWNGPTTTAKLGAIYPSIERELQTLASGGGRVEVNDLSVSLPRRDYRSSFAIEWPEAGADDTFSWPSMLLKTKAKANVSVSTSFFDFFEEVQGLNLLVASGFVKRSGDRYEMEAEYADGLFTINGAPMTIPVEIPW